MFLTLALAVALSAPADECLGFVSENLAKGDNNFFTYYRFSDKRVEIRSGDQLVYDVFLDPKNPLPKGGMDIDYSDGGDLRDAGALDQESIRAHSDGMLRPAVGKWYTRRISLDSGAGKTAESWNFAFEGDAPGRYAQFIDNVGVLRANGTTEWVYRDGIPTARSLVGRAGYTVSPSLAAVDRALVDRDVEAAVQDVLATALRIRKLDQARRDIEIAQKFVVQANDRELEGHIKEAKAELDQIERNPKATSQEIEAALHTVQHALQHTHPAMEEYTGHLVGHAHIDLAWLWEWQEGLVATRDTFTQAVKFMEEYPGFTFSQSSSALYKTIEEHYPDLFKKIQEKVRKGQWELVGGRISEGDTNMASAESHARHFLYAQRYFRSRFGKTATVGWEPDTFGHTVQMPQILKLGGVNYYYFCRAGKGKPVFWWKALDGTKVLTFEEPATGGWYNNDLSYQQFQEMLDFRKGVGSKDSLMVYGVGNHGGGPTREMILEALRWMKDPTKPKVKFSTATEFFNRLEKYDLSKVPVIADELNPIFQGCYTSQSEIKQLNRLAEHRTATAEAAATVASMFGFNYPKAAFQRNWEDIGFHHHHDTLPGSGIHPSYDKTKVQLGRAIAESADIAQRAMESLTTRVTPKAGGQSVMVFNPTGWPRSAWVDSHAVTSGWSGNGFDAGRAVAEAPDGALSGVEVVDPTLRTVRFFAGEVPAFGYKVFHLRPAKEGEAVVAGLPVEVDALENEHVSVRFDQASGTIKSLVEKSTGRELAGSGGLGRIETHFEAPGGMSAWSLGRIRSVEAMPVVGRATGKHSRSFTYRSKSLNNPEQDTVVTQTFTLLPGSKQVEVKVDCDWQNVGNDRTGGALLRAAFDTGLTGATATYETPFGAIVRPANGEEVVGLNWQDLSTEEVGLAVLNDSKHGMSADGATMRLSLIRASYDPDPKPNIGKHVWHYTIAPHAGDWRQAQIVQRAMELNEPMLVATVPYDARGSQPAVWSALGFSDPTVVTTGLKRSEDGNDLVVRMFQSTGAASHGWIDSVAPIKRARWVNFVEDDLGDAKPEEKRVPLVLRPFEIRTVRISPK